MATKTSKSKTVTPRLGMRYCDGAFLKALEWLGGMGTAANVAVSVGCRTQTADDHLKCLALEEKVRPLKRPGSPFRVYALLNPAAYGPV